MDMKQFLGLFELKRSFKPEFWCLIEIKYGMKSDISSQFIILKSSNIIKCVTTSTKPTKNVHFVHNEHFMGGTIICSSENRTVLEQKLSKLASNIVYHPDSLPPPDFQANCGSIEDYENFVKFSNVRDSYDELVKVKNEEMEEYATVMEEFNLTTQALLDYILTVLTKYHIMEMKLSHKKELLRELRAKKLELISLYKNIALEKYVEEKPNKSEFFS